MASNTYRPSGLFCSHWSINKFVSRATMVQHTMAVISERPILRNALRDLLVHQYTEAKAVELLSGLAEAAHRLSTERIDLAVWDWAPGSSDRLEALRDVKTAAPHVPILVISPNYNAALATRLLRSGADGCITLKEDPADLHKAIRFVASGRRYLPTGVHEELIDQLFSGTGRSDVAAELTKRELQVFELLGEGRTSAAIAERLTVSEKTVHTHRENIKRKLGLTSAGELIHNATRWVSTPSLSRDRLGRAGYPQRTTNYS